MGNPCPCKECSARTINCHSSCTAYKGWAAEKADTTKWLNEMNRMDSEDSVHKYSTTYSTGITTKKKRKHRPSSGFSRGIGC